MTDEEKAIAYDLLAECQHDPACVHCTACALTDARQRLRKIGRKVRGAIRDVEECDLKAKPWMYEVERLTRPTADQGTVILEIDEPLTPQTTALIQEMVDRAVSKAVELTTQITELKGYLPEGKVWRLAWVKADSAIKMETFEHGESEEHARWLAAEELRTRHSKEKHAFTCPDCGSHHFGTNRSGVRWIVICGGQRNSREGEATRCDWRGMYADHVDTGD